MPSEIIPAARIAEIGLPPPVVYFRVSGRVKSHKSLARLARQQADGLRPLADMGITPVHVVSAIESGKLSQPRRCLDQVIDLAIKDRTGLVGYDCLRLLRSEDYDHIQTPWAEPTPHEWKAFFARLQGILYVATIAPPGMGPRELRALAIKRGQRLSGDKGGRPHESAHYDQDIINDLHLWDLRGKPSLGAIAQAWGVSKSKVQRMAAEIGYRHKK